MIGSLNDCAKLEKTLAIIETWSEESNINFKSPKYKVLIVTRKISPFLFNYHIASQQMIRVDEEKELGVTMVPKYKLSRSRQAGC